MLAHRLVLAGVGGRTVEELNDTMTISEFMRWQAFYEMFPWGYEDVNFARLLHLLASVHSRKDRKPNIKDFLIGNPPTSSPVDPEAYEAMITGREEDDDDD